MAKTTWPVVLLLLMNDGLPARDLRASEGAPTVDFCVSGLSDARDRLRSGVVRATSTKTKGQENTAEVEYFLAFDFDKEWLRFDRREGTRETKYARNSKESLLYVEGSRGVVKRNVDAAITVPDARPFDIRKVGIFKEGTFFSKKYAAVGYDEYVARIAENERCQVASEPSGTYRLTWSNKRDPVEYRRSIWVDPEQGFSPIKTETIATFPIDGELTSRVDSTGDITWSEINEVWVPIEWIECRPPHQHRFKINFDWKSVNEKVDEELFTIEGFKLDDGTLVVNDRLGDPIVESRIGDRGMSAAEPSATGLRTWVTLVSVVVFAGVAVLFVMRRRRRGAAETQTQGQQTREM